jgi:uncharacterized protein YndB with AHSA1/START domain
MTGLIATASTVVDADKKTVWQAITDPAEVKQWFFGTDLATDWTPGSAITWSGEWEGKPYQDKGEVLAYDEPRRLSVTHFSPLTGQDDVPGNYHTLVYELSDADDGTSVTLSQDNNGSEEEAEHSTQNWTMVLEGLKKQVEGS